MHEEWKPKYDRDNTGCVTQNSQRLAAIKFCFVWHKYVSGNWRAVEYLLIFEVWKWLKYIGTFGPNSPRDLLWGTEMSRLMNGIGMSLVCRLFSYECVSCSAMLCCCENSKLATLGFKLVHCSVLCFSHMIEPFMNAALSLHLSLWLLWLWRTLRNTLH